MNEHPINTRCPSCHTTFNVTNGQLKVADGLVRCGGCLHVFNALQSADNPLSGKKQIPNKTPTSSPTQTIAKKTTPATTPVTTPKILQPPAQHPVKQPTKLLTKPITNQLSTQSIQQKKTTILLPLPQRNIELFEKTITEHSSSRYISHFLIISLVALCVAQILWFQKDKWIQDDQFRPIYKTLYSLIDQPLPARRSADLIINKQFIIQPHAELADAIRISILLENSAGFSQPFPTLQLIFTDLKGRTTAQRTLPANEYVNTQLFPQQLMPSKQPIQIQLDMMAPGRRAVGYQLNLISG